MTSNEYQKAALRTAVGKGRCLNNAGLGLAGEAGECADLIKKHSYQGHDLDKEKLANELGDVLWYVSLAAHLIGYDLSEVMEKNIFKLKERYPEGFEEAKSINRKEGKA